MTRRGAPLALRDQLAPRPMADDRAGDVRDQAGAEARAVSPPVRLHTFAANAAARRFYERHRFAVIGGSDRDNEEGIPEVPYARGGG